MIEPSSEEHALFKEAPVCEGCGAVCDLKTPFAAFAAGWDTPPYFTVVVSCPNCSSAEIVIKKVKAWDQRLLTAMATVKALREIQ